jgi:tetratricopeptide (TPR) repeat protein
MKHSLYEVLGVNKQASSDEIKQAFFMMVSQYPPEKEPEKFKVMRTAYETLSDPKAREAYDSISKFSGDMLDIYSEVEYLKFKKDWDGAIEKLQKIIKRSPNSDAVRNQLGLCYIQAGKYTEAQDEFEKLTGRHPDVPLYWNNRGQSFKRKGDSLDDDDPRKAEVYKRARECFLKACGLKTTSSQPYLAMSDMYLSEKNYKEAVEWADKAIQADGQIDFHDFEAMFQICKIHIYDENEEEIDQIVQRIISIIPHDSEYRTYVSARFKSIGGQLFDIQSFSLALHLLKGALKFKPEDGELKNMVESAEQSAALLKEYEDFAGNREIVEPLRRIGAVGYSEIIKKEVIDREEVLEDAEHNLHLMSIESVLSSIEVIKKKYPEIYRLNASLYDKTEKDARSRQKELSGGMDDTALPDSVYENDVKNEHEKETFLKKVTGKITKFFAGKTNT